VRRPRIRRPRPKLPNEPWFRIRTRVRAAGHWTREKAQLASPALARAGRRLAGRWAALPEATRRRAIAVAAILCLYSVVKFAPVPGVPCQVSAAKECSPPNDAVALVPADAMLYAHLTLERDSHQYELAAEIAGELPDLRLLVDQIASTLHTPSGAPVDLKRDVLRWADRDLAVALLPGPRGSSRALVIVGVEDEGGAEEFLAKVAPPGDPKEASQGGSKLDLYPGGFAAAEAGEALAFGSEEAVRAALDAGAGRTEALDPDAGPLGELPALRFAEVYLSRKGVKRLLGGGGAGASQLDTFVDYGATTGMAASATARDAGVEVNLISDLDPELLARSPSLLAELPSFEPELASEAGSRALGYVGVGELGPTLSGLLGSAGEGGAAKALRDIAKQLRGKAGVDQVADLLPALSGQAALVAEPTDGVPFASLIVDGVDEDRAIKALTGLEGSILKALVAPGSGVIPRVEDSEVDGVAVRSAQISPTVNLSYAVFDDRLVVSTDPAGIAAVRAGGDGLEGSDSFERATDDLPDRVSALVFLNLDELLGLAEQAGLAEDPLYASLSDDIAKIGSLGLAVTGDDEELRTELFLAID
jgi:hypothetical protein